MEVEAWDYLKNFINKQSQQKGFRLNEHVL